MAKFENPLYYLVLFSIGWGWGVGGEWTFSANGPLELSQVNKKLHVGYYCESQMKWQGNTILLSIFYRNRFNMLMSSLNQIIGPILDLVFEKTLMKASFFRNQSPET